MTVYTKSATPVDVFAGQRLRAFRLSAGLSQTEVATALGVTFQQIQKYERGANRMGASRLDALATLLGVNVSDFFDAATDRQNRAATRLIIETSQERRLILAFRTLTPAQRAVVTDLVGSMKKDA